MADNQPKTIFLHAYLDTESETLLKRIREEIEQKAHLHHGPDEVRPHITLGSWDLPAAPPVSIERLAAKLESVPALPVSLSLVVGPRARAYFSLSPAVSKELLAWHEGIHAELGAVGTQHRLSDFPGRWVPRCALFQCEPQYLPTVYDVLARTPFPIEATISSAGFAVHEGGLSIRIVATVDLARPAPSEAGLTGAAGAPPAAVEGRAVSGRKRQVEPSHLTSASQVHELVIRRAPVGTPDAELLTGEFDRHRQSLDTRRGARASAAESLADHDALVFCMARLGKAPAGCGALLVSPSDGAGEIVRLYVRPEHRTRGIGTALVRELELAAWDQGVQVVRLRAIVKEREAVSLFTKAGYQKRGSFGRHADNFHSVFLEKVL